MSESGPETCRGGEKGLSLTPSIDAGNFVVLQMVNNDSQMVGLGNTRFLGQGFVVRHTATSTTQEGGEGW